MCIRDRFEMENFKMVDVKDAPRVELHNQLGLTGCEISINELPPKAAVPFVHAHKQNEEVYGVLGGKGQLYIDGQVVDILSLIHIYAEC